eukprot:347056_1
MYEGKQRNTTKEMVQIFLGLAHVQCQYVHSQRYLMNTKSLSTAKYITRCTNHYSSITLSNRYNSTDKSPPPPQHACILQCNPDGTFVCVFAVVACLDFGNSNVVCLGCFYVI